MSDHLDEVATWARARDGDAAAFAALFRQHQARIYRRALALVSNAHDAEDVTAATFFELWRKRRTVRVVDGTVVPWLLVTTVNFARNHRRGTGRYKALIASLPREEPTDAASVAVTNIETELLGLRLTDALAHVSATDAALLVLTALDDLSITDAATAGGIKSGTARMRLHRARSRLRADLSDDRHLTSGTTTEGEHA